MAGETVITVVGNLVDDPELRFTPSGAAVANFRIASTPRTFDRQTNEWKDGDALFLSCSVWRQAAENVAESLTKGMRVVIQGRLKQRSYEDREGQKRTVVELEVEEVGPSLKYATAKIARVQRSGGGGGYGGGGQGGQGGDDPWASNPGQGGQAAPAGGQSGGQGGQGGYGGGQPRGGSGGSGGQGGGSWGGQQGGSGGGQPQNDPWASSGDEPPF
ncbi:single-stranded DNA-binding protein [Nocardioides aurantiacus]|uniref:Single-stranded DNA-binding protein n=1 Tax=Nocardioides aurantiacus TaxID=86796 RepID=A0A3N2CZD9_9ACTN|nr:single-stranded DNA-binding protein [Nocardioides aurantiacus]ROR92892.1 single-strand binding protein [Nocardioides aurantiacus]